MFFSLRLAGLPNESRRVHIKVNRAYPCERTAIKARSCIVRWRVYSKCNKSGQTPNEHTILTGCSQTPRKQKLEAIDPKLSFKARKDLLRKGRGAPRCLPDYCICWLQRHRLCSRARPWTSPRRRGLRPLSLLASCEAALGCAAARPRTHALSEW